MNIKRVQLLLVYSRRLDLMARAQAENSFSTDFLERTMTGAFQSGGRAVLTIGDYRNDFDLARGAV